MRPETGPEKPCKRASFSKATPRCPASRNEFSRPLASPGNGKKPLNFSGFRRYRDRSAESECLEPLAAAPIRAAVAIVAIPVETTTPAAVVAVTVKAAVRAHTALPHTAVVAPAFAAAKTVLHVGQHGKPALLAVIQRLVERVGGIGDFLHRRSRGCHVVGALAQACYRIVRLLLAVVVLL